MLDLNMPGEATLPAIESFLEASPRSSVLVLTMVSDPFIAREALSAGANGYVLKEAAEGELVEAVRAVASGQTYLAPSLGARLATLGRRFWAPLELDRPELAIGTTFAGYRLEELVGRGGMGVVYRATDTTLDRPVALKLIAPEAARDRLFRARFERECRLAAAIDHPHVVPILHAGENDGSLYLAMRYVDGTDLHRLLDDQGALEPDRAVAILAQIGDALDHAHGLGLVHRDVKPANVLLSRRPKDHALLTDFGLSKRAADRSVTQTVQAVGTVDYMAPEQARGAEVDARADVYSLGCVFFHMLTGHAPFERDNDVDRLWAHLHEPPPALAAMRPGLPAALQGVLDRALAKEPDRRPGSAGELAGGALTALRT